MMACAWAVQDRLRGAALQGRRRLARAAVADAHPEFFDLRADPFERGEESFMYNDWFVQQNHLLTQGPPMLAQWLESFKEFPPRAQAASFSIDEVVEKLMPKT
jgi:hypothetical protein